MGDKEIGVSFNKIRGAAYERLFVFECMARGLYPHEPTLEPPCHDMIVMDVEGNMTVTQVKSTTVPSRWRGRESRKYAVKAVCNNGRTKLSDSIVDVLAIYVPAKTVWYLIPTRFITGRSVALRPHLAKSKGSYEKYKGEWSVFGVTSDLLTYEDGPAR